MKRYIQASQSNEQDSMGNPLTPEQSAFFKDSKIRDSQGRLLVCYHGTKKAGFEEFLPQDFTDALFYKFGKANVNCFTTDLDTAKSYSGYQSKRLETGEKADVGPYDFADNGDGTKSGVYAVYLNIKNPLIVDPDDSLYDKDSSQDVRYWKNIKREGAPKRANIEKFFKKYSTPLYEYEYIDDMLKYDDEDFEQDLKRIGISVTRADGDDLEYEFRRISNNNDMWSDPNGYPIVTTYIMSDLLEELESHFEGYQTDDYYTSESTNDIILDTLFDHPEYDGIIFKRIFDTTMFGGEQDTIVTLKGSNQIKSIFNQNPTSSGNINAGSNIN